MSFRREAMFPAEMPRPQVEALSEPFWTAAREGRLDRAAPTRRVSPPSPRECGCVSPPADWLESAARPV